MFHTLTHTRMHTCTYACTHYSGSWMNDWKKPVWFAAILQIYHFLLSLLGLGHHHQISETVTPQPRNPCPHNFGTESPRSKLGRGGFRKGLASWPWDCNPPGLGFHLLWPSLTLTLVDLVSKHSLGPSICDGFQGDVIQSTSLCRLKVLHFPRDTF